MRPPGRAPFRRSAPAIVDLSGPEAQQGGGAEFGAEVGAARHRHGAPDSNRESLVVCSSIAVATAARTAGAVSVEAARRRAGTGAGGGALRRGWSPRRGGDVIAGDPAGGASGVSGEAASRTHSGHTRTRTRGS
ncbi:unnamed protein product [Lampetra planeri]